MLDIWYMFFNMVNWLKVYFYILYINNQNVGYYIIYFCFIIIYMMLINRYICINILFDSDIVLDKIINLKDVISL